MQNVGFTKGDLYWLFENANMQNMMILFKKSRRWCSVFTHFYSLFYQF